MIGMPIRLSIGQEIIAIWLDKKSPLEGGFYLAFNKPFFRLKNVFDKFFGYAII